jgi:hypothetical protein
MTIAMTGCDPPPESWVRDDGWLIPEWESDSDSGSDSATDEATDTGIDTGIDTEGYVACDGEPVGCEDIGEDEEAQFYGCCYDNAVYWCQEYGLSWLMVWKDCGALGLDCALLAEQGFLWCI